MQEILKVKALEKSYSGHKVLKGVDFSVNKGEIFALLGTNGAGKTTTLECIEGLRSYDAGSIEIKGDFGIQLQSSALPAEMKCKEALQLVSFWQMRSADWRLFEIFGVDEFAEKRCSQLSTGQKRRLHLALAMVSDPDIIFLDEPTAGLDVEGRAALHAEISKLRNQAKTVILASHDMAEVESLCDRIAILRDGKIFFEGAISKLNQKMSKLYHIKIKSEDQEKSYEAKDIVKDLLKILQAYKAANKKVLDISVSRGSLEEHFIKIAKGEE